MSRVDAAIDIPAFIRANLPLRPVPGRPDIVLHRATPASRLARLAQVDPDFGSPYWAYPWGGGLALAAHLAVSPQTVAGRRVLDLGSGSGLVAIAAARAGAADVTAADTDPYAAHAIALNAAANGVTIRVATAELSTDVDVVLAGDVFYAADVAALATPFLARCRAAGAQVLVGDVGRAFLPLERLTAIADYPVADFGDGPGSGPAQGRVFTFD